jgi:hypothetical protein
MDWLSRDLQTRTKDGGRMFSVLGEEVRDATRLINLICVKIYATWFRMSDLQFLLDGEVFRVQELGPSGSRPAGGAARSPFSRFIREFPVVTVGS